MATTSTKSRRTASKRPKAPTDTPEVTLGAKLKLLRRAAKLSQVAIGAQGFVSAPGWIKIENGQRLPSEEMIQKFVAFMVVEKVIHAEQKQLLFNELCALKYVHHRSDFLRLMAREYQKGLAPVVLRATLPGV